MIFRPVKLIALAEIERSLAPLSHRGRPRKLTSETILDSLEIMCRTSQPWRQLPVKGASPITLHNRFRQLQRDGAFDRIHQRVVRLYQTCRRPKYHITDTSYIKNVCGRNVTGRNPTDRGRKATKLSTIVDDLGATLVFALFPGNQHDQTVLPATVGAFKPPLGIELFADKGYDSRANRAFARGLGYRERIAKRGQRRAHNANRKRVRVEHTYAHLKQFRHLRNRYDHLACSYRAFVMGWMYWESVGLVH